MAVNKNILTSPVTIDVSWEQKSSSKDTLDLTAFLLNESGQVSEISDMVFYGTTEVVDMKLTSTKHHITIESKHNKAKNIASQCMTINLDLLPEDIKHIRFDKLKELYESRVDENNEKYIGTIQKLLIEGKSKNNTETLEGRTNTNKVVIFKPNENNKIGEFVSVKITEAHKWYLKGEII